VKFSVEFVETLYLIGMHVLCKKMLVQFIFT